jgi:hypothetical protein
MKNRLGLALLAALLLGGQARPPALAQSASRPASDGANESAAQQTKGGQPAGRAQPRGGDGAAARAAEHAAALRKAQAVALLKGVVEGSGEIKSVEARARTVVEALGLLWKHDEAYARANFLKAAEAALDLFASEEAGREQRAEAKAAVITILKALARHDPRASEKLMARYLKLAEEAAARGAGDSTPSLRERLSLAEESLDLDPAQSAALAAKVIEAGVPGSFPQYLNELERRDATAAASLFRTALSLLGGGAAYNPSQATLLSAYAFREAHTSVPVPAGDVRDGARLEFGTFASPLSPPSREVNRALVGAYLAAASAFLNAQALALEQRDEPDAGHVGVCYFLVKKLRGYADKLGLGGAQTWQVLESKFLLLAERAKLSDAALGGLAAAAQRIVTTSSVFRFDGGASAFERAEQTRDAARKTELLVGGIRQLIDGERFAEAEQRISDVGDERAREQLTDYLRFRAAEAALRRGDWDVAAARTARVGEERARAYLLLEAARLSLKAGRRAAALDHLRAALASLSKTEDAKVAARLLVAAAGLVYEADAVWGGEVLAEAVKAINRADGYDGRGYGVTFAVQDFSLWFPLDDSDLARCFERAAKADWAEAVAAAQRINAKELQAAAYTAASRAAL